MTRLLSLTVCTAPIVCSLGGNYIGPQGAAKLAEVLSQTKITTLE